MAFRLGVTGLPNSGKSFSWMSCKNGEEVFGICPSSKILHVRKSDGTLLKRLSIRVKDVDTSEKTTIQVVKHILKKNIPLEILKIEGNYVVCSNVHDVLPYKLFVSKYMPHIKVILTPDFTHYISYIIQSPQFQSMKAGGAAFTRFWELAADTLRNIILSTDRIRENIIDVTEFHSQYNDQLDVYELYTPAGKMLTEKFKPETYFDVMLYTHFLPYEQEQDDSKRYKFVITNKGRYSGRSIGLFSDIAKEGMIPNDMSLVLERLNKYLGNA